MESAIKFAAVAYAIATVAVPLIYWAQEVYRINAYKHINTHANPLRGKKGK